jgi:hypothetical protein
VFLEDAAVKKAAEEAKKKADEGTGNDTLEGYDAKYMGIFADLPYRIAFRSCHCKEGC